MGKMRKMIGTLLHGADRMDALAEQLAEGNRKAEAISARLEAVEHADAPFVKQMVARLCGNREEMKTLRRELSICPAVWGDEGRLSIADTASVDSCFFNTNSGTITIGEYTFAGSNVSVLAGSHDAKLTGKARREGEKTDGCDIRIGDGVWLCSGCTVLGPCEIGNDAVIAAGAVVTPGTKVPAGAIWGGVPAKEIGRVYGEGTDA